MIIFIFNAKPSQAKNNVPLSDETYRKKEIHKFIKAIHLVAAVGPKNKPTNSNLFPQHFLKGEYLSFHFFVRTQGLLW